EWGRVAQPYSVVRTRERVAGAGYACSARPDLHTICRSFPKISSAPSAKVCGGSKLAKSSLGVAQPAQLRVPFGGPRRGSVQVGGSGPQLHRAARTRQRLPSAVDPASETH